MSILIIIEHLFIVISAFLLSLIIGIPLGVVSYMNKYLKKFILTITDIIQTIPTLALLGILMIFFGAGKITVIIGITLYSLLPIIRNTCLGLQEVDEGVKESAKGMGMSRLYQLIKIELPLAIPTILTGVRIAIVNAVGIAVFASFVGGGGLGGVITRSIRIRNMPLLLLSTGALIIISMLLDTLLSVFENKSRKNYNIARFVWIPVAILIFIFSVTLPLYIKPKEGLLLYDGDYSETQIMNRIAKILIEDKTELNVNIQDQMSQVNNFNSLKGDKHSCDLMISYDGTLLTTFLGLDPTDIPDNLTLYEYSNQVAKQKYDMRLLEKLGFNNTYVLAVSQELASKYNLEKISDLKSVASSLVFGAEHEFFTEEGSMKFKPFTKFYGLDFKDVVSVDVSLKYTAAENRNFDVTVVYATDGLNQKAQLKLLEDDLNFFPEYNGAFLIREDTLTKYSEIAPELESVLNLLSGQISNEDMMKMTYEVDVLGKDTEVVAREFLVSKNLIGA